MDCGIIMFIYDRPRCTNRALEALKRNHIEQLYVFQDGLGEKTDRRAWEQNETLIKQIDWCDVVYEQNKQKADSLDRQIIYGINKVLQQKDAVIVIEDDCVISDDCIRFMKTCLIQYEDNRKVIEVGAYLEPIRIPEGYSLPIVAAGIPAGQVWGTWKDCWEEFQDKFSLIRQIGDAMKNNPMFCSCGYPIKKVLTEYWMLGTWDLWWSIYVLLKGGISVRPTDNKVYNIGFENPGTHTSGESLWVVPIGQTTGNGGELPEDIMVEPWAEKEFGRFYQSVYGRSSAAERHKYYRNCLEKWLELKQSGRTIGDILLDHDIKSIAIYGTGKLGKLLADDMCGKVELEYFIVTNKIKDTFMEYPVYDCGEELPEVTGNLALVVIPGYDLDEIKVQMGSRVSNIYSLDSLLDMQDVMEKY